MGKYIVCDLDGTLCNHNHRLYLAWSKNWNDYNAGCVADTVNQSVLDFLGYNKDCKIIFLTGRPETYEQQTWDWITTHLQFEYRMHLIMRKEGDYRKAAEFKRETWCNLAAENDINIKDIFAVIDDDESCCEMFRELGIKNVIHYKGE